MAQHPQPPVLLLGSVDAAISQVMAALSVEATAGVTLSAASLVIAAQTLTQCALRPLRVSNVLFGRNNTIPTCFSNCCLSGNGACIKLLLLVKYWSKTANLFLCVCVLSV